MASSEFAKPSGCPQDSSVSMNAVVPQSITILVSGTQRVSGLLQARPEACACCRLAQGAGAGMTHPFRSAVADGLAGRRIATLRYEFPYMERGAKRPDAPERAHAHWR